MKYFLMIKIFLVIACFVLAFSGQARGWGPFTYSFQNFVLTWPGSFCQQANVCDEDWRSQWDGYW